jgi:hypothetical protein
MKVCKDTLVPCSIYSNEVLSRHRYRRSKHNLHHVPAAPIMDAPDRILVIREPSPIMPWPIRRDAAYPACLL